ncbi:MAG: 3-hydroxyacyl-CoA dehydrogenase family protein [Clostridiales Family XIII bacterium]|jgi:3-hydroxybutyryl-CoA dehydrogenase|nr:3-hydroxyacyl-CoA dehydrogenase family protein [Clostridiales Family XIII bacterium]
MKAKEIKKVAVVGAGTMGNQIAMQVANSGFAVACYSRRESTVSAAEKFADGWYKKNVEKGKVSDADAALWRSRLKFTNSLSEAVTDADIVVEAVADVLETKRKILAEIDAITPDHAIYASNSSYIVSSKFADAVKRPENVLNVHFFNPALIMKLVEVVQGPHVSNETVETVFDFAEAIGKTPILVKKEIYGFVVNRIFSAITKEACYLLDQKVASIGDIDMAVRNGLGHPMGPLQLLDLTGIDLEYDVLMEKYRMTGDLSDKPSPAIVERYAKGHFGKKSKNGFYEYE